jgi:hypothetical protein
MNKHKKVHERVSLYVPKRMYEVIDAERIDVPRSKFILRILEKHFSFGV